MGSTEQTNAQFQPRARHQGWVPQAAGAGSSERPTGSGLGSSLPEVVGGQEEESNLTVQQELHQPALQEYKTPWNRADTRQVGRC